MSLPTLAIFKKDDNIVGAGWCNPGWFWTPDGLRRCVNDALIDAWERKDGPKENAPAYERQKEIFEKYFTNEKDLANFHEIIIGEFTIPREISRLIHKNIMSDQEWNEWLVDHGYFNGDKNEYTKIL